MRGESFSDAAIRPGLSQLTGSFVARVSDIWPFKLVLYFALSFVFCLGYFGLQRFPFYPARTLPLSSLDQAIGFHPSAVLIYQSVYLLIPLFPFLARTPEQLFRYTRGFAWLCGVSFLIFALLPIAGPRPDVDSHNAMFQLMTTYDAKSNAMPSLHLGLAVYSVLFGYQLSKGNVQLRRLVWVGVAWTFLIAYATLATKQHYAIDLLAGGALAALCHCLAWRKKEQP
jgi:membrane-associated phospholipid phosphatase